MNYSTLEAALGLSSLWEVSEDPLTLEAKRLDITFNFEPASTVAWIPQCRP
jgi:hypothetical protein